MKILNLSRENIRRIDTYVKGLSKGLSHISAELEQELIRKYRKYTEKEKEKVLETLIAYNTSVLAEIAINVINTMKGGDRIDPLDLMQVGILTFMKKLDTWDESKNAKMITYYYRDVKTQMQRFVMSHAFPIRQGSVFLQHLAYSILKLKQKWLKEHNREPDIDELAEQLGIAKHTIQYCINTTSIYTMSLEDNWIIYENKSYGIDYNIPPVYFLLSVILKRLYKEEVSESLLFSVLDFLDKKKSLNKEVLEKLRKDYLIKNE